MSESPKELDKILSVFEQFVGDTAVAMAKQELLDWHNSEMVKTLDALTIRLGRLVQTMCLLPNDPKTAIVFPKYNAVMWSEVISALQSERNKLERGE